MVPSDGQHGFLSIKGLGFLLSALTFGAFFLRSEYKEAWIKSCMAFGATLSFLILWFLIGLIRGDVPLNSQFDQFKLFIVTFYFPFATYLLLEARLISLTTLYKIIFYSAFSYVFCKVMLVTLHLLGGIDLWAWLDLVGFRFMRMDIIDGLDRVQTSADLAPPFIFFFVLRAEALGIPLSKKFKTVFAVFTLLSTFLSFSRLLLFVYVVSLGLAFLTLSLRTIRNGFIALLFLCTVSYIAIGPTTVHQVIERRFFSRDNTASDDIRIRQIDALYADFIQNPFLGKGLGASASSYIRDPDSPHSYEVQWMAFLLQFGLLGSFLLSLPFLALANKILNAPFSRFRLALFCSYALFLTAGFTNPFLISLASGVLYTLYFTASSTPFPYPLNSPSLKISPSSRLNSSVGRAAHS